MSGVDLKQKMIMVRKSEYERLQKENAELKLQVQALAGDAEQWEDAYRELKSQTNMVTE